MPSACCYMCAQDLQAADCHGTTSCCVGELSSLAPIELQFASARRARTWRLPSGSGPGRLNCVFKAHTTLVMQVFTSSLSNMLIANIAGEQRISELLIEPHPADHSTQTVQGLPPATSVVVLQPASHDALCFLCRGAGERLCAAEPLRVPASELVCA